MLILYIKFQDSSSPPHARVMDRQADRGMDGQMDRMKTNISPKLLRSWWH